MGGPGSGPRPGQGKGKKKKKSVKTRKVKLTGKSRVSKADALYKKYTSGKLTYGQYQGKLMDLNKSRPTVRVKEVYYRSNSGALLKRRGV